MTHRIEDRHTLTTHVDPLELTTVGDIVGLAEFAEWCERPSISIIRLRDRRDTNGFPEPLRQLKRMDIYSMSELQDWYIEHMNRPTVANARLQSKRKNEMEETSE